MGSPNEAAAEPGTGSASVDVSHTTTTTTTATGAAVNTTPAANNSTDSHSTSSSNGSSSNSHDDPGGSAGVASLKTIHAQANGKASGRISCTTPQPGQQPLPTQSTTIRPATPPPEGLPPPPESSQVTAKASTDGGPEAADADAGDASALCSASSTVSSASGDHYCLRWTNHGSHVLSVFSQLLRDEALVDVTLAAEGQSLRAHKMVLSACSSFFRTLFVSHPERHPIIILKDTKFDELKTLLEYMYKGEVSVEYGQLGTLLKTAENLRVKGLAEVTSNHAAGSARRPDHTAPATDEAMDEDDSDAMDEDVDDQMSPIVLERERLPAVVESEPCHPHRSGRSLYPLSRGYAGRSIYQPHKSGYRHGSGGFGAADGALSRPYSQNHRAHPRSSAAANQDAYVKRHHPRHNHLTHPQHPAEDQQQPPTAANPPESNRIKSDTGPVNGTDLTRRKSPPRQSSGQDRTSPQPTRQSTDQCGSGAEDLRRVAADSPLPPESFRTGTSARPPAATNNIGHFWHGAPMDDESESSESDDCDEFGRLRRSSMAGHEPSLIGRQPPPHFHPTAPGGSSSARLDPPQHFPLPLKKEADWTSVGLNMAPGTSRSDAPASRSPSFSESSSEYGRHADQEEPGPAADDDDDPPILPRPPPTKEQQQARQAPDPGKWSADEGHSGDGHHAGPQPTEVVSPPDLIDNAHVTEGLSLADPPIVQTSVFCCPSPASCTSSASRLARHMLVHSLRCDDPAPQQRHGHKRRHLSAVSSSLAPASRPPTSAPIFSCLNLIAGSHLEELNRSRQVAGPCFSFGSSPSSSGSSRSRHHSSEVMALAEDLRSRPSSRNQGPLSLIFPNSGPGPLASSGVLDGSFGSLAPGVAVLASLMGGGVGNGVDSLSATDLSLGSVMFPSVRLATSQTGQSIGGDTQVPAGHVATASAAPPFANLSLQSYSAAAAALALTAPIASMCSSTHSTPSSSSGLVASSNCSSSSSSGQQSVPVASCATTSSASNLRSAPPALCKFCGKSFVELAALMAHLPFHTGERPFRCDFCGKAFKLRHHMKDHARVHTGERPFPCRLCGKTFSRSTILKAHEKTHLPKAERGGGAHFGQPPVSPTS